MSDVVMPQMGESIAEGTIVRWIKKVGDRVDRDEPLFEISTDKVDAEIPSPVGRRAHRDPGEGRRDRAGQLGRRRDRRSRGGGGGARATPLHRLRAIAPAAVGRLRLPHRLAASAPVPAACRSRAAGSGRA